MRSRWVLLLACILVTLLACRVFNLPAPEISTPTASRPVDPSPTPTAVPTHTSLPPAATATATVSGQLDQATHPAGPAFAVRFHPEGPLYVGDQVSFEIIAPPQASMAGSEVRVALQSSPETPLGEVEFAPYGIGARQQATLYWAWDTTGLQPGSYPLIFSVLPAGPVWTETVTLLPAGEVPPPQPHAQWQTATSQCCVIHYLTGTAAARDLDQLIAMVDEQARLAGERVGAKLDQPAQLTFLPRVLGHGGFAGQEISVSYLDRNYAGSGTPVVLHHELVHLLDSRRTTDFRPSLLVEGLAVYLSGGHFKPEPLMERAAALLPARPGCDSTPSAGTGPCSLGWYLPLAPLADDFYRSQHEIGYLQAGALVEYMVETWGWEAFNRFYTQIKNPQQPGAAQAQSWTQSQIIDAALQEHFGLGLPELEAGFQQALAQAPLTEQLVQDVRLTVAYYDAMRRYQLALDPSAHFLTAWLPDAGQMRPKGIAADFLRHPAGLENIALEAMLVEVDAVLRSPNPDYSWAESLVQAVNQVLDGIEPEGALPAPDASAAFLANPLAADYLSIAQALDQAGYQAQRISLGDGRTWDTARVLASRPVYSPASNWRGLDGSAQDAGPQLLELNLYRTSTGWSISQISTDN